MKSAEEDSPDKNDHVSKSCLDDKKDFYAVLGLGDLRWKATEEDIRRVYRRLVLKYHPDKQVGETLPEEEDENFKLLQKAYDTLSNLKKRREFDSQDDFDETLPKDKEPKDFYKTFGPVFEQNGRWSVTQPVPELGDDDSSEEHVNTFYNFWFEFVTWREFAGTDEHDLDSAECREERRWMERKNTGDKNKKKKDEVKRIGRLIEMGMKYDPRLKRQAAKEKEQKNAKKNAKKAEAERLEKERLEKEAADKLAAETADADAAKAAKAEKSRREKEKKAIRKLRQRLRAAVEGGDIDEDTLELVCANSGAEELETLCAAAEADKAKGVDAVEDAAAAHLEAKAAAKSGKTAVEAKAATAAAEAKPWTSEEQSKLAKGLVKFPSGSAERWEAIAAFIGSRSASEVLKQTKALKAALPSR